MGVFLDEKLKMESQTRLCWNAKILEEFNTVVSIGKKIAETTMDDKLTEINEKIVDPSKLKLTAENFLNPLNSLDLQMRAADMLQMDLLARKIFLNLEIDQQKTVLYRYKEPFQTLISGLNQVKLPVVSQVGLEPTTLCLRGRCSNQLSY